MVFYGLPMYAEFYPELVNMLEGGGATCRTLYSRFDALALSRVVGSSRGRRMLAADDSSHVLVTGHGGSSS